MGLGGRSYVLSKGHKQRLHSRESVEVNICEKGRRPRRVVAVRCRRMDVVNPVGQIWPQTVRVHKPGLEEAGASTSQSLDGRLPIHAQLSPSSVLCDLIGCCRHKF
jgi:hypothetical protein